PRPTNARLRRRRRIRNRAERPARRAAGTERTRITTLATSRAPSAATRTRPPAPGDPLPSFARRPRSHRSGALDGLLRPHPEVGHSVGHGVLRCIEGSSPLLRTRKNRALVYDASGMASIVASRGPLDVAAHADQSRNV